MAATLPTLPLETYEPTYPAPASWDESYTPANATALQTALSACTDGNKNYLITLTAGTTYSGNFVPASKSINPSGTGWILIRSSSYASLPASNFRAGSTHAAYMAKIEMNDSTGFYIPAQSNPAHHIWWHGIEFTNNASHKQYHLIEIGAGSGRTTAAYIPHHFVFDHCWFHGYDSTHGELHGAIHGDGNYINIRDCTFERISVDWNAASGEGQCFNCSNGYGPFTFRNNFFGDSAEYVMFGGDPAGVTDLTPSDITILFCHFKANAALRGDARYFRKNMLESKNCRRMLVRGCIFENMWYDSATAGGQNGAPIVLKPATGSAWSRCEDVTIRECVLKNCAAGFQLASHDYSGTASNQQARVRFYNVFGNNIRDTYGSYVTSVLLFMYSAGSGGTTPEGSTDVIIDHCTFDNNISVSYGECTNWPITALEKHKLFETRNSIWYYAKGSGNAYYGWRYNGDGDEGDYQLSVYYDSPTINKNIVIASTAANWNDYGTNWTPASDTGLFVDKGSGNFRLAVPGDYVGDDSLTVGANIDTVEAWTLHTEDGQNPQELTGVPSGTITSLIVS